MKSTDDEDAGTSNKQSPVDKKKRKLKEDWIDSDMKCWATALDWKKEMNPSFASLCNVSLKASSGKTDLLVHAQTNKHISASNAISAQKKIDEWSITCSMVADHLVNVCQSSFSDSDIATNMSLGRTKANAIVKNVIGKKQFSTVCELLRNNKFSLCVDESTDLSNTKSLCLVVRVCFDFNIQDLFFGLLKVQECDAKSLYKLIVDHFTENNINYRMNMVGFAADGTAVMTGKNNSVAKLLKDDIPDLFIIKCVCHSLDLCSSYACLQLPSEVETLTRNIYNYLSNSPKRFDQFQAIQELLEIKPKKILHPCQTRWLYLEAVVVRILNLFEPLKIYFSFAANVDDIDNAKNILDDLNDSNQIYLSFLKYILEIVNKINKVFQSESTEIHTLYNQIERLVKIILSNFIKHCNINIDEIYLTDFMDKNNFLDTDQVYLGLYASELILKTKLSKFEI
ncbi:SCAN domain-containing protein 3 [Lucilia cuprina]|nr:SCAN domain-containing protein 3 [Lucilia cuprina]